MLKKEEAEAAYQALIQLRRNEIPVKTKAGEVEIHHIIPVSCGGSNEDSNKISLYAKEHFMAHVYLWIIHHDDEFHHQTMCALNMMIKGSLNGSRKELRDFILASEEYQKAREEFSLLVSKTIGKKVSGKNNGAYGKSWYHDPISLKSKLFFPDEVPNGWKKGNRSLSESQIRNWIASGKSGTKGKHMFRNEETGQIIFLADGVPIPEGFVKGKGHLSEEQKQKMKISFAQKPNSSKNPQRIEEMRLELRPMYKVYLDQSFEAMCAMFDYKYSQQNFCMRCKSFLPEYMNGARKKHLSYDQVWKIYQETLDDTKQIVD